jgi:hypothetical protein
MRLDVSAVHTPQQLDVAVTVHRAVRSRSQFARTIDGELLGGTVHRDVVRFSELHFDPGGAIPITVDVPNLRMGVYPVAVELVDRRSKDVVASLVTHLVRVPDEPVDVPLRVAWVQRYGADPALQSDGTVTLADDDLDALRTIASHLDDGVPLTIVPTPETIAALATADSPQTLPALATLLRQHQVLAAPYVDLDVSALVGAGRTDDLARQRVEGDRTLRNALQLSGDGRTWSFDGTLTRRAVQALGDLGVSRLVVDEPDLVPLTSAVTGGLTLARPFTVAGDGGTDVDAVAVDEALGAHFRERDPVLAAHHLIADLAVLQLDAPGVSRGVVIRAPADAPTSDELLSTVMVALRSSPLVDAVTLDGLFDSVEPLRDRSGPVVREVADAATPSFGIPPGAIDRARARMDGFASIAGTTNPELATLDRLVLVSETSDLRGSARLAYLETVDERIAAITSKVRVLGDRTYRLTAREGKIPLTLVNDNPFEVRVDVELTSDTLAFTESGGAGREAISGLVLRPNGRTTLRVVPVKARTSGQFQLRVTVRSPDGQLELGRTTSTITSTVASGVGLVLSVGAALFLLLWWGSHWRTVRRARRLVATAE